MTSASFQQLLARFPAFSGLDDDRLRWLSERSKPFVCPVGQELLLPTVYPITVSALLKVGGVYFITILGCIAL